MKLFLAFILSVTSLLLCAQDISIASLGLKVPPHNNCTSVKDQAMSSTCWSFSSISILESEVIKKGKQPGDLSEMFVARYSYVRKIERHLATKGKNFFTPGGQFHDVVWVMKNYGMVPEQVYSGRVNGERSHDHTLLDTAMLHFVNDLLLQQVSKLSAGNYASIDSILDLYLGKVPAAFNYKGKQYNAKTFLQQYLGINPDDYIEVTSYSHHPFHSWFVLEDKYNWTGDQYYNVSCEEFLAITNRALKNGYTVGWDGDVDEPGFDFNHSVAYLPQPVWDNVQLQRQTTFEDSSTAIGHMMQLVSNTKDNKGRNWFLVKNSWGNAYNALGGFLFMSNDYFLIKTGAIIVNKKFVGKIPAAN
jgi:bleomycin hydrolase